MENFCGAGNHQLSCPTKSWESHTHMHPVKFMNSDVSFYSVHWKTFQKQIWYRFSTSCPAFGAPKWCIRCNTRSSLAFRLGSIVARRSDSALEKLQLYHFPMNKTASQKNMNLLSMFSQSIPDCRMHTSPQLLPGQPITWALRLFAMTPVGNRSVDRWIKGCHFQTNFSKKPLFWRETVFF